jgi:hypothetical protein
METFSRVSDFEFTQSEVRDLVNLKDEIVKFEDRIK